MVGEVGAGVVAIGGDQVFNVLHIVNISMPVIITLISSQNSFCRGKIFLATAQVKVLI